MAEDAKYPRLSMYKSQQRLDLSNFTADQVTLEDIAFGLARIPRYVGQTARPYSVAEHSMMVMRMVEAMGGTPMQAFEALHHDDAEYITGDIPSPVKLQIPGVRKFEKEVIWPVIAQKFGLSLQEDPLVKQADWIALFVEAGSLCSTDITKWERAAEFIPMAKAWVEGEGIIPRDTMPHPNTVAEAFMKCHFLLLDHVTGDEEDE